MTKKIGSARPVKLSDTGEVIDRDGNLVTDNPRGGRYRWIKFDVQSWLSGTTRWIATGIQCAFWLDLLAQSGNGRFPGWVCAGQDAGKMVGYPIQFYQSWRPERFDVLATFRLFEEQGKIHVHITREKEPKLYAIEIVNWSKFQSDLDAGAARVRKHREKKRNGNGHRNAESNARVTKCTPPDLDLELDQEQELEKAAAAEHASLRVENTKRPDAAAENLTAAAAFSAIGFDKRVGNPNFQTLLVRKYEERTLTQETQTEFIEAVLQECQARGIGVPPQVYAMKRRIEEGDLAKTQPAVDDARRPGGRN